MTAAPASQADPPAAELNRSADGRKRIVLTGDWTFGQLSALMALRQKIRRLAGPDAVGWDLRAVAQMDTAGALVLWQLWHYRRPRDLALARDHERLLERWQTQPIKFPHPSESDRFSAARLFKAFFGQLTSFIGLFGQIVLDGFFLIRNPAALPWGELSLTIYQSGVRALGITALVGFLIGIVLSYLSALQLKLFGAEIYIIDILGLSIIRELGPLLAAILVAGRSGSAMTAEIGIMRVTEELDALSAMGISHSQRLVVPKVTGLTVVLPLLSVWTNAAALIGGMVSARHTLDIGAKQFLLKLPDAVPVANVFIGLGKSAVFGMIIALIACHFGFRIQPNTESLGNETTNSVVTAITAVIMVDALFAVLFMDVGLP